MHGEDPDAETYVEAIVTGGTRQATSWIWCSRCCNSERLPRPVAVLCCRAGSLSGSGVAQEIRESLLVDVVAGLPTAAAAMGWTAEAAALYRSVVDHPTASQEAAIRATNR